ncbi:chymotrypsinogen B [Brachionus plicatilis]|uniref:Chymotrypsinogen B n=1 Tax=Brachionus plicatilis TaxID=10195 RepID=A0A3M7Q983_BRAPC|nr:chymotrypsinogen B [Brachionus plicatilis]
MNCVDPTRPSLENGSTLRANDSLQRSIRNRFTKKIWVKRRRTPPIINNADNKRNSSRSAKYTRCGTPLILPNVNLAASERIINGKIAFPNSWPWLVSIRQSKNSELYHVCAGSLISSQHVLTAAHCVLDYKNTTFAVVIGINNLKFQPNTLQNDIAILYLNIAVKFSRKILPICLPSSNNKVSIYGKTVMMSFFSKNRKLKICECRMVQYSKLHQLGSTNGYNSQKTLSNRLLQTTLQIKNFNNGSLCRGYDDVNYCALDSTAHISEQSNICFGDSGGSLMHQVDGKWYLYGISSFIYGNKKKIHEAAKLIGDSRPVTFVILEQIEETVVVKDEVTDGRSKDG